jgi:uncharacterized cupin superfamily protein
VLKRTWEKLGEQDQIKYAEMPKMMTKKARKKKDDDVFRPELDL